MYLLSFETWCDEEMSNVVRLRHFENKINLIDALSEISTNYGEDLISICEFNVYSLKIKPLKMKLNEKFKIEIEEVKYAPGFNS